LAEYQVSCINKPDRYSAHEHITHIGGIVNGQRWRITREETIRYIESKQHSFYTVDPTTGKRAQVGVRRDAGKTPY
jgi:hypothetical protein